MDLMPANKPYDAQATIHTSAHPADGFLSSSDDEGDQPEGRMDL